ncbi:hypothetical protein K443DRAFT_11930 [Laccaria amethystina LaAM-08-1]|uniref:Uncharacterized protein n=1 Tax=Laccaria amethystina LaAM-08-1 TaxID=1095629 RepID=A0A0C9XEV3_9AGAR|nr:hypothetical protein K443DRAFT_11930 [Laccaria amethystina LaAM-08-1]
MSALSHHQGSVNRSIEMYDLKPVDVLLERFTAWKAIVRQLTAWFEDVFYTIQDQSCIVADHHADLDHT